MVPKRDRRTRFRVGTAVQCPASRSGVRSHARSSRRPAHRRWPRPLPVLRRRRPDRALHRDRPRARDHRLPRRLHTACSLGVTVAVTPEIRDKAHLLHRYGGSPIGNSRVKLTNVKDCVKRGLVKEGQDPQQVAADQLIKDGVDVLHTIGGDDTNTTAADLAAFLHKNNYELTVIGLPKTIDNDVIPIRQSLGAWTAAEQGAIFANVVAEHSPTRAC